MFFCSVFCFTLNKSYRLQNKDEAVKPETVVEIKEKQKETQFNFKPLS